MSQIFVIGQRVTWTDVIRTSSGRSCSMRIRTREGKITSITGEVATVSRRGATPQTIHVSSLTSASEQSELTRSFLAAFAVSESQAKGGSEE